MIIGKDDVLKCSQMISDVLKIFRVIFGKENAPPSQILNCWICQSYTWISLKLFHRFVKIDRFIFLRCFLGRSAGRRRQYIGLQGDYWKGICAAFTNFANFSSDRLRRKISISFPILSLH